MNLTWLLRMSRWARRPPSRRQVVLVLSILVLCLALALAEWAGLLPEGFGLDAGRRLPRIQSLP